MPRIGVVDTYLGLWGLTATAAEGEKGRRGKGDANLFGISRFG
jgi:hypothetical protein